MGATNRGAAHSVELGLHRGQHPLVPGPELLPGEVPRTAAPDARAPPYDVLPGEALAPHLCASPRSIREREGSVARCEGGQRCNGRRLMLLSSRSPSLPIVNY